MGVTAESGGVSALGGLAGVTGRRRKGTGEEMLYENGSQGPAAAGGQMRGGAWTGRRGHSAGELPGKRGTALLRYIGGLGRSHEGRSSGSWKASLPPALCLGNPWVPGLPQHPSSGLARVVKRLSCPSRPIHTFLPGTAPWAAALREHPLSLCNHSGGRAPDDDDAVRIESGNCKGWLFSPVLQLHSEAPLLALLGCVNDHGSASVC